MMQHQMMDFAQHHVNWKALFAQRGFPFLFAAMAISLFGTGMNYSGVTWYILEQTNSTVDVGLMVILLTLPGLVVPPFGGVLIDRVDRRYLGVALDAVRATIVLGTAALLYFGAGQLWHVYVMVTLLGAGFAVYWSTINALTQEVVQPGQMVGANSAVLIAVQGGMMTAGALVGFLYDSLGVTGILAIDGASYLVSAVCLLQMRRGYRAPHHPEPEAEVEETLPTELTEEAVMPMVKPELATGFLADFREGLRYLRGQPRVFALGLTYACMIAGVISANVLVVVLARNVLRAGPHGYGWMQAGWALGAIAGGFAAGLLARQFRPMTVLVTALATLAVGHTLYPYVRWLALAVAMHALFGSCRALGGVLTQASIMTTVPRRLMGRTQSAFSVMATLLQVAMSFSLGWLAQHVNLPVAFLTLGLLYAGAALAAVRARGLSGPMRTPQPREG
jgi:MFS family permease